MPQARKNALDADAEIRLLRGGVKYLDPQEARLIEAREGYGASRAWEAWKARALRK